MEQQYREIIAGLVAKTPLAIDPDIEVSGAPPTLASSEFLTNKEQGDWAEEIVFSAINENSEGFCAVRYGRAESISAGDPEFVAFYEAYQAELNTVGKKPDILIFKRCDISDVNITELNDGLVSKAVAALEVRSSAFLVDKYSAFMADRSKASLENIQVVMAQLLEEPYSSLLKTKSPLIFDLIIRSDASAFRELDFRLPSWSSSPDLLKVSELLRSIKKNREPLLKRDYLSITPKVEDIALVNRWIQRFNVRHFYLQVLFDKAYILPFKKILEISSDPTKEGIDFSIARDVKNQRKTTIKINVGLGTEILGRIDMPEHYSYMKELERGRLLFYVKFKNGKGYLDQEIFERDVLNG